MMSAIKILSVDDEAPMESMMKQFFRREIRNGEYEFYFARNGVEALDVLNSTPGIEIILLDINMPEMDGLTLLSKVNEMHNPALRVIMVSAYGDMANIRQAMNNGAFDFATKPIDMDDLSLTIEKAIKQINYVHESQKEHSQLESLKKDLTTARNLFCNFACTSIIKLFKLCLFSSQSSSCPSFMLYTTTSLLAAKLSSCCWLSALSFSFNRASLRPDPPFLASSATKWMMLVMPTMSSVSCISWAQFTNSIVGRWPIF